MTKNIYIIIMVWFAICKDCKIL